MTSSFTSTGLQWGHQHRLDMQLTQFDISHVILIGMIAHTCIEATGRSARTRLPCHFGEGCDRRLQPGGHDAHTPSMGDKLTTSSHR